MKRTDVVRGLALILAAVLSGSAHADDESEIFDERLVCANERSAANDAANDAARVPKRPDDAAALAARAAVERARRDLANCSRPCSSWWRKEFERQLNNALAGVENTRATWRAQIAQRDATAKALANCVAREKQSFVAREEAQRLEAKRRTEEEAAKRERIDRLMSNGPVVQLALSALVCVESIARSSALRAIADEKRYARIGGVQNNAKLYGLQEDVRASDKRSAGLLSELKRRKLSALGCGNATIRNLAACVDRPRSNLVEGDPCLAAPLLDAVEAVRVFEAIDFE